MTRLLLYIKHNLPFLWVCVEWLNTLLFRILHGGKLKRQAEQSFKEFTLEGYAFRMIENRDLQSLRDMILRQANGRLTHFRPHLFEMDALRKVNRNPAFMMFGVFQDDLLVGYFFLRCFWNRKCFVGRLIEESHEKKGIGRVMNQIMYHTAWRSNFRIFTTVSRQNQMIIRSHMNNPTAYFVSELPNDFLLLEFLDNSAVKPQDRRQTLKEYLATRNS